MDAEAWLERAERAFGGRDVAEVVVETRAIVGVYRVPNGEEAAQRALDELRAGRVPSAADLAALEFVVRMLRPAPLSRGGALDPLPAVAGSTVYSPELVALYDRFREEVRPLLYSIGRIDRAAGDDRSQGTGFLVAPDLLVTNRHVLDALSFGTGALDAGQAVVFFHQEARTRDPDEGATAPVIGVEAVHDELDVALLRLEAGERARPVVPLEGGDGGAAVGTPVAAIGYPQKDPNSPLFAPGIFGSDYGVKRAAVGEVLGARPGRLLHDCSTLGGNSGSPIFALDGTKVVGLHASGLFMYRNEAIPARELASFVASAGG